MPDMNTTQNLKRDLAARKANVAESVDAIEHKLREKLDLRGRTRVAMARGKQAIGSAANGVAGYARQTGGFVREHPYSSGGAVLGLAGLVMAFVFRHELAELGRRAMAWWQEEDEG